MDKLESLIQARKRMTQMLSLYLTWSNEAKERINKIDEELRKIQGEGK